ncbi:uncharacterized protein BYT42DRAFT_610231 [Radiomyces spectabilis]|uniref:uncharacterized protein n=1 Tax=Radiomyces spectabilis TaxID=64574 RepID=UPI00221FFD1C|nr:uncharacterized protein BYT42DRAFT_610231 [Radiomyces spectabilis]KAI8390962.1 hypothetical protein BYT42DRAFT_610231 [Radiomyces spectabilis]
MTTEKYKVGDKVQYRPLRGTDTFSEGIITEVITKPQENSSGKVMGGASREHPSYVIENCHTKKATAYESEVIEGRID